MGHPSHSLQLSRFRVLPGGSLDRLHSLLQNQTSRTALTAAGLFLVFFVVMAWIQFSTPNMPDNDGYYHIKFANIMRTEGLKPEFPWLPLTILNPREFYDHHFLFHVGLIPFTFGDLRLGAKWAAVTFASLAFLSVWWLLMKQRIPYAALWALGLLVVSQAFLYRMSITRAQSLSLAVLILGLEWLLSGKYRRLLPLAFFYVWLYDAFPLMMALAGVYVIAVGLIERRLELRPLVFVAAGIGLGLLINPYFPYDIVFAVRHMLPKLAETTSVRVGMEWYPYTTQQLGENSLLALGAFLAGTLALGLRGQRMDLRTATTFFLAVLFGIMLFQARRFIEYFPAFALVFAAFAWAPLLESWRRTTISRPRLERLRPWLPACAMLVFLVGGAWRTLPQAQESLRGSKPYDLFAGASAWLKTNTPAGERVFQTDWDDFPRLFFYNTHNTYIIGLDPTYMQLYSPELYGLWVEITQGKVAHPSQGIHDWFKSSYVVTDLLHNDFLRQASDDPGLREVYRDEDSVVFQIVLGK
jgi:hypothetical protein